MSALPDLSGAPLRSTNCSEVGSVGCITNPGFRHVGGDMSSYVSHLHTVCANGACTPQLPRSLPQHSTAASTQLPYTNDLWQFQTQTGASTDFMMGELGTIGSMDYNSPAWADYDQDGFMDLFVITSTGPRLFQGGKSGFTSISSTSAHPAAVLVSAFSATSMMRAVWVDANGDGLLDMYITEGRSGGNSWLYFQNSSHSFTLQSDNQAMAPYDTWPATIPVSTTAACASDAAFGDYDAVRARSSHAQRLPRH